MMIQVYTIFFERLNTGGSLLKNQEVRNCIYWGKLNDLLQDLNKDITWRSLLGKDNLDAYQKDVELILRFLALFHWTDRYRKPMKDFLSSFMRRNRNPVDSYINDERNRFQMLCKTIYECLGEKPFHPRGALNTSVCDSILVAFARNFGNCPSDIKDRYIRLLKDKNYIECVSRSTTDVEVVARRLALAEDFLFH